MVKIYKQPFAHSGDTIAIPDASQPDGKMSSADGWTVDYQLPKIDPNYKPVGRQEMNGVFKEVTEALGQVQVQGSATWSADGAPYPIRAQVYHNSKQWLALRANSVAPTEGEDWTEIVGKQYVDASIPDLTDLQPSMTGSATLNGTTNNTVQLTDIVTTLGLEVGDVIRIQYSGYNKLHSVESITNNNLIRVNYEHAGNRGNGGLKLADETAAVTITRIAKWYNAPIGLGQAWVVVAASRSRGTTYTNATGKTIMFSIDCPDTADNNPTVSVEVDGALISENLYDARTSVGSYSNSFLVPPASTYKVSITSGGTISVWAELR